jgi:hypothetical protein
VADWEVESVFSFGNRLGLVEAHRFSRGDGVTIGTGQPARLSCLKDWLAVGDHLGNVVWQQTIDATERCNDPGTEG